MYVIEQNNQILRGPAGWTQSFAEACGLKGNKTPPATPFVLSDGRTLRSVTFIPATKLDYQNDGPETREFVNGVLVVTQSAVDWNSEQVTAAKPNLKARADKWAEDERAKYVTTIWGQEVVYVDKESEAKAYKAWTDGGSIGNAPDTPYLTAEAAATNQTIAALVATVLANSAAWRPLSAQIEAKRAGLKATIDAAQTAADLRAIEW